MRNILLFVLAVLFFASTAQAAQPTPINSLSDLLYRMEGQESGHKQKPKGSNDGGLARGWMQLHRPFVTDVMPRFEAKYNREFSYEEICDNRTYAREAAIFWFERYCKKALAANDYRTLAARFNQGLKGEKTAKGEAYWQGVLRQSPAK